MSDEKLWGVIAAGTLGTVATIKRDGRPQLSDVSYIALPGLIRFSTRTSLAKVHNLRRDARISIKVSGEQGYAVAEGTAELTQVAWGLEDEVVEELVEIYRLIRGQEHPDWDEFRRAMVTDGRLVVRIKVEHLYGWVM
ncbi:PPOX class F420-dependent enzyme [Paractinoplanes abujensis]|uniref:PPOX class probable F420-dependent enzyme n=1 Tax=Paractinoplanes abujensis TaxID=882441 RepID=A0A7W7CZW1_9ACTN|nr:TIGR03618 family F420-dependent PPOX class oxidoreductase [Actinoplanes abujensis]MBB4697742.1 PPOX class probable F420-dependent enzyme [Actinoplanes abujensis]GID19771.1 PPOX class F420-dependent enzyme [Actinoplanes abujensis]